MNIDQNESVVDVFNPTLETRAPQSQPQVCIGTNGRDSGRGLGAGQSLLAAVADHSPKRARVRGASSADETAAEIETCSEELNDSCSWLSLGIAVDLQVILSATSMGKNGLSDVSEIDLHVLRPVKASLVFGSSLYRLLQAGATSFKQVERLNAQLEVQKARWMLEDAIALRKISLFGDIEDETDASVIASRHMLRNLVDDFVDAAFLSIPPDTLPLASQVLTLCTLTGWSPSLFLEVASSTVLTDTGKFIEEIYNKSDEMRNLCERQIYGIFLMLVLALSAECGGNVKVEDRYLRRYKYA
ncbi:hypothetical protein HDU83_004058 [Entophlyctis luteolus]|nr:hypothetical protein HDU83_004058 [Entophlyctis luteolus]